MNVALAALGIVAGAAVGVGIDRQQRRERHQRAVLAQHGTPATGTVLSSTSTGRFSEYRRITVRVADTTFVETLPALEASQLGVAEGRDVAVRWSTGVDGTVIGRVVRDDAPGRDLPIGWIVGAFIGVLAIAAGLAA